MVLEEEIKDIKLENWRDAGSYVRSGKAKIIVLNVSLDTTKQEMKALINEYLEKQ